MRNSRRPFGTVSWWRRRCQIFKVVVPCLVMSTLGCDSIFGPSGEDLRYDDLVVGGFHACARSTEGTWYCWGHAEADREGALQDGRFSAQGDAGAPDWTRPSALVDDPGLVSLSAGETFTCGLDSGGRAYCWGRNGHGELGLGSVDGEYFTPLPVDTPLRFKNLANGSTPSHMCALDETGRAYCWGNNFRKQLGAGVSDILHPDVEPVQGDLQFRVLAIEPAASCALDSASNVYCWGALVPGLENDLPQPELQVADSGLDTLVASNSLRCGLRSHQALCAGINISGYLGVGDTEPHEGFVAVAGNHEFRQISAGRVHVCGVTLDGDAFCWGSGRFGRLGNGSEEVALVPVRVQGGHRFAQVEAGGEHTCGLTTSGAVYCWGYGVWGQLGNGDTQNSLTPVEVADPSN